MPSGAHLVPRLHHALRQELAKGAEADDADLEPQLRRRLPRVVLGRCRALQCLHLHRACSRWREDKQAPAAS
jgi:hypothetical protein